VRELEVRRPAIAAVYSEAVVESLEDGVLRLAFPEELAIYVKLAGESKRTKPLQEILEERLGMRPRLEFRVSGADSAVNGEASVRPRPPREVPEAVPEAEPLQSGVAEDALSEAETRSSPGGETESDDMIRDPQEVFAMVRERFGSKGNSPGGSGDPQSKGS
jgi:hypothetical protein